MTASGLELTRFTGPFLEIELPSAVTRERRRSSEQALHGLLAIAGTYMGYETAS
jgi:hypothetical protein